MHFHLWPLPGRCGPFPSALLSLCLPGSILSLLLSSSQPFLTSLCWQVDVLYPCLDAHLFLEMPCVHMSIMQPQLSHFLIVVLFLWLPSIPNWTVGHIFIFPEDCPLSGFSASTPSSCLSSTSYEDHFLNFSHLNNTSIAPQNLWLKVRLFSAWPQAPSSSEGPPASLVMHFSLLVNFALSFY